MRRGSSISGDVVRDVGARVEREPVNDDTAAPTKPEKGLRWFGAQHSAGCSCAACSAMRAPSAK